MNQEQPKTNKEYALQYNVGVRTIKRWRRRGYPLNDPAEVAKLRGAQKNDAELKAQVAALQVDAANLTMEQLAHPPDLAHAVLYESILRCRKLGHELRQAKSQVISIEAVRAGVASVNRGVTTVVGAMPADLSAKLVGKSEVEIQQTLAGWTHAALTELSNPDSPVYG